MPATSLSFVMPGFMPGCRSPRGRIQTGCFSTVISIVMPGFMPGIHVLRPCDKKDVDGRDEPGHDAVLNCRRRRV